MNITMRTPETEARYQAYLLEPKACACCFCRELAKSELGIKSSVIREWKYWFIAENDYPYDKLFKQHDMLAPKRHVDFGDLTVNEIKEYEYIMEVLRPKYHQLMENLGERVSQKNHWHIHFAIYKD